MVKDEAFNVGAHFLGPCSEFWYKKKKTKQNINNKKQQQHFSVEDIMELVLLTYRCLPRRRYRRQFKSLDTPCLVSSDATGKILGTSCSTVFPWTYDRRWGLCCCVHFYTGEARQVLLLPVVCCLVRKLNTPPTWTCPRLTVIQVAEFCLLVVPGFFSKGLKPADQ